MGVGANIDVVKEMGWHGYKEWVGWLFEVVVRILWLRVFGTKGRDVWKHG
jgi:hypothetical protein